MKESETISLTEENKADLSMFEDLAVGLMNLISLEEHFFFSHAKTNNPDYLTYLEEVRTIRKKALARIVKNPKGEEWCASKHLLASSMRFQEVGTKLLSQGKKEDAEYFFQNSFQLFSLFFLINSPSGLEKKLGMEKTPEIGKPLPENKMTENGSETKTQSSNTFWEKITTTIKKTVDCCKE